MDNQTFTLFNSDSDNKYDQAIRSLVITNEDLGDEGYVTYIEFKIDNIPFEIRTFRYLERSTIYSYPIAIEVLVSGESIKKEEITINPTEYPLAILRESYSYVCEDIINEIIIWGEINNKYNISERLFLHLKRLVSQIN